MKTPGRIKAERNEMGWPKAQKALRSALTGPNLTTKIHLFFLSQFIIANIS